MPIYEYRCSACGHELEALQKFADAPLATCPSCQKDALVKKVSAAGFQLKGSGWYATDFKGSGAKPAPSKSDTGTGSGDAAAKDGAGKGESKTEAAGESKSETKTDTSGSTAAPAAKTGTPPAAT